MTRTTAAFDKVGDDRCTKLLIHIICIFMGKIYISIPAYLSTLPYNGEACYATSGQLGATAISMLCLLIGNTFLQSLRFAKENISYYPSHTHQRFLPGFFSTRDIKEAILPLLLSPLRLSLRSHFPSSSAATPTVTPSSATATVHTPPSSYFALGPPPPPLSLQDSQWGERIKKQNRSEAAARSARPGLQSEVA